MKIELIKTEESDGVWYHTEVDGVGKTQKRSTLENGQKDYEHMIEFLTGTNGTFEPLKEVINSTEL